MKNIHKIQSKEAKKIIPNEQAPGVSELDEIFYEGFRKKYLQNRLCGARMKSQKISQDIKSVQHTVEFLRKRLNSPLMPIEELLTSTKMAEVLGERINGFIDVKVLWFIYYNS